jgi:endonuclease III-like uncharacterized protein
MKLNKLLRTLGISEDNKEVQKVINEEMKVINELDDSQLLSLAKNKRVDLEKMIEGAGFVKSRILKKILKTLNKEIEELELNIETN